MPVTKSKQGKPLGGIGAERQSPRIHSLILDDRLLSKQYVASVADNKVDNTAYGIGWDGITDKAPSVAAVYSKINSMGLVTHEWTHESDSTSTKVRSNHTGYYGIGAGSGLAFSAITERLTVDGNIKSTGKIIAASSDAAHFTHDDAIVTIGNEGVAFHHIKAAGIGGYPNPAGIPGLLLFQDSKLFFNDTTEFIHAKGASGGSSVGILGLGADTEIDLTAPEVEINATTIDLNGAADISGNLTVGGNTTISGNLTVNGTATSISTAQVTMEDPILLLNADSTGADVDSGIEVERGSVLTNRRLFWDEGDDVWKIQTGDSTFTEIAGGGGTLTGTNTGDVIINVAAGVPANTFQITAQTVTFADAFIYNTGTTNKIGVDGGADGKLSLFGTEGGSGTGTSGLIVKGGNSASGAPAVSITGALEADTKSFNIPHPLDSNKRLVYGCLEGPEYGMYQRGSFLVDDERRIVAIDLPNYWFKIVYDDYAINLTTYGDYNVWISDRDENGFWVETNAEGEWSFDWSVIGGRKDAKLVVEPDA